MSADRHDRGADLAAYALGSLEPGEVAELQLHLRECDACREELTALDRVVEALPMGTTQHPVPSRLRRRVRSAVRADLRRAPQPDRRIGFAPRTALAGALALVVLAVAAIGVSHLGSGPRSSSRTISAQVAAPPTTAQVRLTGDRGQLIVRHMPAPPAGRIYEVWLKRGTAPPSPTKALFSVTSDGAADVDVPGELSGVDEILVTQEPPGGSRVSTHSPVIVARLT